jgi:hypothetical protein
MVVKLDLDLIIREAAANFAAVNLLPNAQFAKQPNKGQGGNKPNCKTSSIACGFACISGKKICRITMTMEQQQAAKALKKELRAGKKEPALPPPKKEAKKAASTTARRDPKIVKALAALDKNIKAMKPLAEAEKLARSAYFSTKKVEGESESAQRKRIDNLKSAHYRTEKALDIAKARAEVSAIAVRKALMIKTQEEALAIVRAANIEITGISKTRDDRRLISGEIEEQELRLAQIVQFTGQIPPTLKKIVISAEDDVRAYANRRAGLILYGENDYQQVVFHEFAHHLEYSDPNLAVDAAKWRDKKAVSKDRVLLSALTANSAYDDTEVAVVDSYVNPYVGKVYLDGATEVVSMGFDHFSSAAQMVKLRANDPSHFDFIIKKVLKA